MTTYTTDLSNVCWSDWLDWDLNGWGELADNLDGRGGGSGIGHCGDVIRTGVCVCVFLNGGVGFEFSTFSQKFPLT